MDVIYITKADCIVHKIGVVAIFVAAFCMGYSNPVFSFKK